MYTSFENPQEFADQCRTLAQGPYDWLLVCLARNEEPKLDETLASFSAQGYSIFGGVFPALVDGAEIRETGAIVKPVKLLAAQTIVQIDGNSIEPAAPYPNISGAAARPTCLVFTDFSCVAVTSLLEDLFDKYSSDVNYFGAGAGNGKRTPSPVAFTDAGRYTGAAVVAFADLKSEVRLRHGWSRNSEHVIATRTEGNVLKELNWEPAMKVYHELVGDHVADSLSRQEGVPEAKRYPFGIAREDLEDVVRDRLSATEAGELIVLSGIAEHSVIHVLKTDNDKLIDAVAKLGGDFRGAGDVDCVWCSIVLPSTIAWQRFSTGNRCVRDGVAYKPSRLPDRRRFRFGGNLLERRTFPRISQKNDRCQPVSCRTIRQISSPTHW